MRGGSLVRRANWDEKAESCDYGRAGVSGIDFGKEISDCRMGNNPAGAGDEGERRSGFSAWEENCSRSAERAPGFRALCLRLQTIFMGRDFSDEYLGFAIVLEAAMQAGVNRRVFVSSMSAYEGCCSMYGKAKLAVEQEFLPQGVFCVRPGLLWSDESRGMFGKLARAAGALLSATCGWG